MADKKISALTGATTPLAGTEVLPIVQGSATVKVSVDNLTAGKTVAGLNFKTNSASALGQYTAKLVNTGGAQVMYAIENATSAGQLLSWTHNLGTDEGVIGTDYGGPFSIKTQGISRVTVAGTSGDTTLVSGNLIQGTAAKGVNFTANTPAAGMTSQLLNWYEEGTFTPVPTSLTVVGTPTYTGKYTRVGRQVFIYLTVRSTTSTASTANTTYFSGLPFVVGFGSTVSAVNNATITDLGIGLIDASSVIYTPSWTSGTNQTITLSGFYYV